MSVHSIWEAEVIGHALVAIVRGLIAPFVVPAEDRMIVLALWLCAIAAGAGAVLTGLRELWVPAVGLGLVGLALFLTVGYWEKHPS